MEENYTNERNVVDEDCLKDVPIYQQHRVAKEMVEKVDDDVKTPEKDVWETVDKLIFQEAVLPDIRKIRQEGKIAGSSGVESFFCDETVCLKEREKQLALAGCVTQAKTVHEFIGDLAVQFSQHKAQAKSHESEAEKIKDRVTALLSELGYEAIRWGDTSLTAYKNNEQSRWTR